MTVEDAPSANRLPLEALLNAAPDGFVVVDGHGGITWANLKAEELFGYEAGELVGLSVEVLVPERLRPDHLAHRSDYANQPRSRSMGPGLRLQARRQDGSEFPVEISLSPLKTPNGVLVTAVVRDITARLALEAEHNRLEIELETERERDRIAMDLHDGIMQDIYAASLSLEVALPDAAAADADLGGRVERTIDQLHEVVRGIRSYIFDLRPRQLSGPLSQALANLANEFQENSQIQTSVEVDRGLDFDSRISLLLYHIAHESLSNVRKHAGASQVDIRLSVDGEQGRLEVRDNGSGFDPTAAVPEGHHGLRNMAARARSVGGELTIESAPGAGCALSVLFPVEAA